MPHARQSPAPVLFSRPPESAGGGSRAGSAASRLASPSAAARANNLASGLEATHRLGRKGTYDGNEPEETEITEASDLPVSTSVAERRLEILEEQLVKVAKTVSAGVSAKQPRTSLSPEQKTIKNTRTKLGQ